MVRRALLCVVLVVVFPACNQNNPNPSPTPGVLEAQVNPAIVPVQPSIPDLQGDPLPVCASRDEQGVQSDFVEGVVLIKPRSDADLQDFLDRFNGTVIDDDTIPVPPPELGITLTDEERAPTEFVVRINVDEVDLADLRANAAAVGLSGILDFSSDAGLRTFACVLDAKAAGFTAGANYISQGSQALPVGATGVYFNTQERATSPGVFTDAFTEPRFGAAGSISNVTLAWQFLFAHGIQRRVRVAIIDDGFWLDTAGRARGPNSDFVPPPNRPTQYDFANEDAVVDGPGTMGCGAGNPCYWHGTGSTSVAAGIIDNRLGYAGTGGLVSDQLLFKFSGAKDQRNQAVRTAVAWGADVVSMSFGGDCNLGCRIDDRDDTPFSDAVNRGSRIVFLAAAGNGRGTPAVGYDVGSPSFVHPCIEDHVICVGALADNTTTKIGYSNFGARVNVFAPTNIPAMSYPNSFDAMGNPLPPAQASGAEMTQPSFGGTSASTPFVAGIVAMMKALNPDLTGDQIAQILTQTARPGTAPANLCVDALAAVRRAAEDINILPDRFENNDLETAPTNLGAMPPYNHPNLNMDARDRDYFRFESPGGATMTLDLTYPQGLGTLSVFDLLGQAGDCTPIAFVGESALGGNTGRRLSYRVPGGPLLLALDSDEVLAYHLGISFMANAFAADTYEPNNSVATARYLTSRRFAGGGALSFYAIDPRVSIDASIHTAADVDYYIVRGASASLAETIFLIGYPAVLVYGNDSPLNFQVFRLNAGNTQGELIANLNGGSCVAQPLSVRLDVGQYFLVRVSGNTGNYKLRNGVDGDPRRFPVLVRDRVYEVLNPGDPVIRTVRFPELYVMVADPAFGAVRTSQPQLSLRLYDFDSNLVAEGVAGQVGRRLDLGNTVKDAVYALEVAPEDPAEDVELELEWEPAEPADLTDNLIENPDAEVIFGDEDTNVPGWAVVDGDPRIFFYNDQEGGPFPDGPGPDERGMHLFAGGPGTFDSILRQTIAIDAAWLSAIDAGLVKFRFSAFLGGKLLEEDYVAAKLVFLNAGEQSLGEAGLPPVTPREREGETGLFPVEFSDYVPAGTTRIVVELTFHAFEGDYIDGYADNLELTLSEYAP